MIGNGIKMFICHKTAALTDVVFIVVYVVVYLMLEDGGSLTEGATGCLSVLSRLFSALF